MKKLLSLSLVILVIVSCLGGCTSDKTKKYSCTDKNHTSSYIKLNKGSSDTTGNGSAKDVYWSVGMWNLTGSFSYTSKSITVTTGVFRGQTFTDGVSMNFAATKITFAGYSYKC